MPCGPMYTQLQRRSKEASSTESRMNKQAAQRKKRYSNGREKDVAESKFEGECGCERECVAISKKVVD